MPEDDSIKALRELLDILADIQRQAEARAVEILKKRGGKG